MTNVGFFGFPRASTKLQNEVEKQRNETQHKKRNETKYSETQHNKTKLRVSEWVIDVKQQLSNFLAISRREQINSQWDDDELHFVLD